jgi:bacterial/archaeal transporter family protein
VAAWFWYAVLAAVLYGAHQIFTRLAAERIGEGLGGFIVEAGAAFDLDLFGDSLVCGKIDSEI